MIVVHIPSWFPKTNKPLDGNFILKQIAAITPHATCIILHHVTHDMFIPVNSQLSSDMIFYPIFINENTGKIQLFKAYLKAFRDIINTFGKPDLIHLHVSLPMGIVAAHLSRRYGIPLIISEHWSIYQSQNRHQLSFNQKLQLRSIYKISSYLTAVSQNLIESIHDTLPYSQIIPNTVISNVVNTDIFTPGISKPHTGKIILHISTLDNHAKNIMGILHAVDALHNQRNDFVLNIIHDLKNQDVENYIQEHHLEKVIHLLGKKEESEVAHAIQSCDFLLQFSNYETQSCVLLEAFCCGKPVLTTPVGGIAEIANSNNAILTEPKDEAQLIEKLSFMLDHYSDFHTDLIRNEAIQRYSPDIIGNQFFSLYQNILNNEIIHHHSGI